MRMTKNYKLKTGAYGGGFTLLEIVIVVAVLTIIGAIVAYGFYSFFRTSEMKTAVDVVHAELRDARAKTIAARGDSRYGVHFESDRVTVFAGTVYSVSDPANEIEVLPPGISIVTIALNGGGADVIFDRLSGNTAQYGSVTLAHRSHDIADKIISVSAAGMIDVN